jgi:glycolate oxidase FAD binding subunit
MTEIAIHPETLDDVLPLIAEAIATKRPLAVNGAKTKSAIGNLVPNAPPNTTPNATFVELDRWTGILDYQPEELVLTVRAGTPMAMLNDLLASHHQMLAFEPPDPRPLFGGDHQGTLGGVLASNASGPRRLTAGAARDFLLGFEAASGRGERFRAGGKVVKNVTGYDLSKLMVGSFGTLALMDEVTLKTLPRPETAMSLLFPAVSFSAAQSLIAAIFSTPHEPSAAAILPADMASRAGLSDRMQVVVRLEGFAVSVADRAEHLLNRYDGGEKWDEEASRKLWQDIRDTRLLADEPSDIWKISCPPSSGAAVISTIMTETNAVEPYPYYADWGGGLIWMAAPNHTSSGGIFGVILRDIVARHGGGFAMRVRAADSDNSTSLDSVPAFEPLDAGRLALHRRIKTAFDPMGILNPNRMHQGI